MFLRPGCVQGRLAIHSPNTGIVDYRSVALSFAEDFRQAGGTIVTGFELSHLAVDNSSGDVWPSALCVHILTCVCVCVCVCVCCTPTESGLVQLSAQSKASPSSCLWCSCATPPPPLQGDVLARCVITCAGLYSDHLARLSGCEAEPRVIPFRGEYLVLKPDKCNLVKGNIYPVSWRCVQWGCPVGVSSGCV